MNYLVFYPRGLYRSIDSLLAAASEQAVMLATTQIEQIDFALTTKAMAVLPVIWAY